MDAQRIPFKYFLPGIAWFLIVGVLVFMPGSDVPEVKWLDIPQFDKLVHAGIFGVLVFLFCVPYFKLNISFKQKNQHFIRVCLAAIVWGIAVEIIQKYFVPGRSFDLLDWAADTAGVLIAYWFCRKIIAWQKSKA
ncbi:MAG: VanZ family protein [Ginsengibacter sp.]